MRPYHEAFPTSAFGVRVGLCVSRICPGIPFRDSGVLLPGAAPNAVAKINVAAIGLSTRNIKHLSSFKLVLLTGCCKSIDRRKAESTLSFGRRAPRLAILGRLC